MCSGSKRKPIQGSFNMESESGKQDVLHPNKFSVLLELSASDDLVGFKKAIEEEGRDVDEPSMWYGRRTGSKKMGVEERTPFMIAALYGSKDVLNYILETGRVSVNRACGSDGATALHCAAAGGSPCSPEVVRILLDSAADPNSVDACGNCPVDLITAMVNSNFNSWRKVLAFLLNGGRNGDESCRLASAMETQQQEISTPRLGKDGSEKKEYPVDLTLPDIKNGIYGTDEFRMYIFKIKPCSRAYSHDWTECPFAHPGENARRRDPRKYHYSCVPCPEFRKGSCRQGEACEYAHGIFECWLHPAQYRTRLCKDETNCTRRVCFFAHKPEELRPLYASTGSAVPSPRSFAANGSAVDLSSISSHSLGSSSILLPPSSSSPMTPSSPASPIGGWHNQCNIVPPTLLLPGSRLKSAINAKDMDLDIELFELENSRRRQQQLMDEISGLSSPTSWNNGFSPASAFANYTVDGSSEFSRLGGVQPTNLEDAFGSLDPTVLPQLQGLLLDNGSPQLQSPKGTQLRQLANQSLHSSYPSSFSSSPTRMSPLVNDASGMTAAAILSSRSAAFAKRSHSFIERSHTGPSSSAASINKMPSNLSDWGSPDGKLDWAVKGDELNKLRKSASFGFRSNGSSFGAAAPSMHANINEPDVSWVHSLVKDTTPIKSTPPGFEEQCHHPDIGGSEMLPAWADQLYIDQEQMVA